MVIEFEAGVDIASLLDDLELQLVILETNFGGLDFFLADNHVEELPFDRVDFEVACGLRYDLEHDIGYLSWRDYKSLWILIEFTLAFNIPAL